MRLCRGPGLVAVVIAVGVVALWSTPLAQACDIYRAQAVSYQQVSTAGYAYTRPALAVATYQTVAAPVKAVATYQAYPQAVKAIVSPDYYSSVQDYYQQKLLVDAITGKFSEALRVQEELQALRQQVQSLQAPPAYQPQRLQQQAPQYEPPAYQPPAYQPPAPSYQPARPAQLPAHRPTTLPVRPPDNGYDKHEAPPLTLPAQPPRDERPPPHHHPDQQPAPPQQSLPPEDTPPPADTHPPAPEQQPAPPQQVYGAVPERLHGIVKGQCIRCHGDDNSRRGGGYDMRDLAGVDRETRLLSYAAVLSGEMPRAAAKLSEQDQAEFLAWFNAARSQTPQRPQQVRR